MPVGLSARSMWWPRSWPHSAHASVQRFTYRTGRASSGRFARAGRSVVGRLSRGWRGLNAHVAVAKLDLVLLLGFANLRAVLHHTDDAAVSSGRLADVGPDGCSRIRERLPGPPIRWARVWRVLPRPDMQRCRGVH